MDNKWIRFAAPVAALLVCLAAGWGLSLPSDRGASLSMVAFGLLNVALAVPGTWPLRVFTIGVVCVSLILVHDTAEYFAFGALLVWPLLFIWFWSIEEKANRSAFEPPVNVTEPGPSERRSRRALAMTIVAVAIGVLGYRALAFGHLEQTSALFVGVPALLAVLTTFFSSPRSVVGVSCKIVTIFLFVTMMFLWEGILCVVMAAPLFYVVAICVGTAINALRDRRGGASTAFSCVFLLALVPAALEGVAPATTLNRGEEISATRIIPVPPADVARALRETPRFDRTPGLYLRAGFPRPIAMRVEPDGDATRWVIAVRGGEMKINGMEPRTGDVVLAVDEDRPGLMRWRVVSDDSHVTHFLWWRDSTVAWEAAGPNATRVTWTLRYDRGLDPARDFGPFERYAVGLAAEYLIDAVATP